MRSLALSFVINKSNKICARVRAEKLRPRRTITTRPAARGDRQRRGKELSSARRRVEKGVGGGRVQKSFVTWFLVITILPTEAWCSAHTITVPTFATGDSAGELCGRGIVRMTSLAALALAHSHTQLPSTPWRR